MSRLAEDTQIAHVVAVHVREALGDRRGVASQGILGEGCFDAALGEFRLRLSREQELRRSSEEVLLKRLEALEETCLGLDRDRQLQRGSEGPLLDWARAAADERLDAVVAGLRGRPRESLSLSSRFPATRAVHRETSDREAPASGKPVADAGGATRLERPALRKEIASAENLLRELELGATQAVAVADRQKELAEENSWQRSAGAPCPTQPLSVDREPPPEQGARGSDARDPRARTLSPPPLSTCRDRGPALQPLDRSAGEPPLDLGIGPGAAERVDATELHGARGPEAHEAHASAQMASAQHAGL